ncbi:MAG: hypothetical protein ACKOJF_13785 [Planctomycetaceae bacterium]
MKRATRQSWHQRAEAGSVGRQPGQATRRGGVMVVVLVIAAIAGVLSLLLVRHVVLLQRQQRLEERVVQADWLVRSALRRGVEWARLDPEATTQVWQIPAAEPEIPAGTTATITVSRAAAGTRAGAVTVIVELPGERGQRIRREGTGAWGSER